MNQEFQAIYENGVLRLLSPLDIPEQTPVRGVVMERSNASPTEPSPEELTKQQEALDKLRNKIVAMPQVAPSDGLSGRDHDAILYGQGK